MSPAGGSELGIIVCTNDHLEKEAEMATIGLDREPGIELEPAREMKHLRVVVWGVGEVSEAEPARLGDCCIGTCMVSCQDTADDPCPGCQTTNEQGEKCCSER